MIISLHKEFFLVGFPFVMLVRLIFRRIARSAVFELCRIFSVEAYSYSDYRKKTVQLGKHYVPEFKIPAQINDEKVGLIYIGSILTHSF